VSDPVLGTAELAAVAQLWKSGRRELVCRFGGTSMRPSIAPEAEVRLLCGEGAAARGDVVAFLDEGRVIVHRVVAIAPSGWLVTRGDDRLLPDRVLRDPENVIGRVVAVRSGAAFADVPAARPSFARGLVLWPLVQALRVSPSQGAALIDLLLRARRRAQGLRARLRGRGVAP
jgi:hypothetical protein